MAIRPEFRWWILTLAVVLLLLGISALALSRPDVVWEPAGVGADRLPSPHCPACRQDVEDFATRCAACGDELAWTPAPDAVTPLSPFSLSALEAALLRERVAALGEETAARRVAEVLGATEDAAAAWLRTVGRGRCGWCGGTGSEPRAAPEEEAAPCSVCFGQGSCVACGGDRHIRVGDEAAHRAFRAYAAALVDLAPDLAPEVRRAEARRLTQAFLDAHAGTMEATAVLFWPELGPGRPGTGPGETDLLVSPELALAAQESVGTLTAVARARQRLDQVMAALARP